MDSTSTADDLRNSKRPRRLAPPPGGGVDVDADRISGLGDDVLLHVLELLPDARDAVRTGALSRRWLGLWTRVPALRFASHQLVSTADLERFVSTVNGALARRGQSDCSIESLAISSDATGGIMHSSSILALDGAGFVAPWQRVISPPCDPCPIPIHPDSARKLMLASVDAVQGWIRYAVQYRVKSLDVHLTLQSSAYRPRHWRDHGDEKKPAVFLGDLPASPGRLETMRLALGGAGLRLSTTTVKFASLTVLSLENMVIQAGGACRLARLVSSPASCPRLQKLSLRKIGLDVVDDEVRIEAQVLSELVIQQVQPLTWLKLRTPSLRVLHIDRCSFEQLSISAPRLEQVALFCQLRQTPSPMWLHVREDLPCVRRVKLCLWSRRHRASKAGEAENNCGIQLLKHCSSLTCLDVTLHQGQKARELDVDMVKRRVPHLPHVTSSSINVSIPFVKKWHGFGASVASLLSRFNNLRHLSLRLPCFLDLENNFLCDHPNYWVNEFSMCHLQEAEFTGFTGIDCEIWFIKAMFASAKRLHKVAISFNPYWLPQGKMDAFERLLLGGGMRTSYRDTYALTCTRIR